MTTDMYIAGFPTKNMAEGARCMGTKKHMVFVTVISTVKGLVFQPLEIVRFVVDMHITILTRYFVTAM